MKNIRYAFASVSYHKKLSFGIGVCSSFFLFLLTSILNLQDIEEAFYNQVGSIINNNEYHISYQKIIQLYSSLYLIVSIIWVVLVTLLIWISLKIKKADMMKWRIMGFSNRFVIQQSLLESIIPIIVGVIVAFVFLIVCQHTYEYILVYIRPLLANGMGITRVPFFSSQVLVENTPNEIVNTSRETHFLTISISSLPISSIVKAFSKNCLLLLSSTTGVTLFSTYVLLRKSQKVYRM